jgi:hypothetical protein
MKGTLASPIHHAHAAHSECPHSTHEPQAIDAGQVPMEHYAYGSRGPAAMDAFMADSGFIKTVYAVRGASCVAACGAREWGGQGRLK